MIANATRGTWAMRAERHPQPAPVYTQAQQRDRRRKALCVTLGGDWSLSKDIAAICRPLASRVAATPRPAAYGRYLDELFDATHQVVHVVVGLLAERDAQRKTAHLDGDNRARSIRTITDLAPRPIMPQASDADVLAGTWPEILVAHAKPYSGALAELLGRTPNPAVSDRVVAALRELDSAAGSLARRLDRDDQARSERAAKPPTTPTETDRARAELAALGVTV